MAKTEQLVNVSVVSLYAYQRKKVRWVRKTMTNLVPVDRRERRGSRQKISRLSVFSPPVLEEQLLGDHWG